MVYKVEVPSAAAPGPYTFHGGSLEYYVEGFPADSYIEPITGDYEVGVAEEGVLPADPPGSGSALASWIALAAVVAGALIFVRRRRTQG